MRRVLAAAVAAALAVAATPGFAQEKLTVWWVKGFYKSEDDALFEAIKKYEAKTGVKIDLSQYAVQDMIPKSVAALDAGKHVLCEARMAMNSREAHAMLAASRRNPSRIAQIVPAPMTLPVDRTIAGTIASARKSAG